MVKGYVRLQATDVSLRVRYTRVQSEVGIEIGLWATTLDTKN